MSVLASFRALVVLSCARLLAGVSARCDRVAARYGRRFVRGPAGVPAPVPGRLEFPLSRFARFARLSRFARFARFGCPGDWRMEIRLEDATCVVELVDIGFEAVFDEPAARASAEGWLEHLRTEGVSLDSVEAFCYVAQISTVHEGCEWWDRVDTCYLTGRWAPLEWEFTDARPALTSSGVTR